MLQSSLVPRHTILLKAGTEAISVYRLLVFLSVFTVTLHVSKFESTPRNQDAGLGAWQGCGSHLT